MRLVVVDASPIGGGPVTRALDVSSAETVRDGGTIQRVRLYELFTAMCPTCTACLGSGRCARRTPALDAVLDVIAGSDALLVGTAGHLHARDPRCDALLRRLVGVFAAVETCRGLERHNARAGARKRAALLSSAPPLLGVPALMGLLPAGLGSVWHVLDRAGVDVVACTSVATKWSGPADWDVTRDRARLLGRRLAASMRSLPATSTEIPELPAVPAPPVPVLRTA